MTTEHNITYTQRGHRRRLHVHLLMVLQRRSVNWEGPNSRGLSVFPACLSGRCMPRPVLYMFTRYGRLSSRCSFISSNHPRASTSSSENCIAATLSQALAYTDWCPGE